jgi:hypothetical protein
MFNSFGTNFAAFDILAAAPVGIEARVKMWTYHRSEFQSPTVCIWWVSITTTGWKESVRFVSEEKVILDPFCKRDRYYLSKYMTSLQAHTWDG